MKNTLFWIALAALSLQDLFKKQSPTKRQQQFLQTGGTAQAFIEGTEYTYSSVKKQLIKIFGQPYMDFPRSDVQWKIELPKGEINIFHFNQKPLEIELYYKPNDVEEFQIKNEIRNEYYKRMVGFNLNFVNPFEIVIITVFRYFYEGTDNEDYKKLLDIANAGDWELALEIAKGQGLI